MKRTALRRTGSLKRTELSRHTELERGGELERHTEIAPVNRERRRATFARNYGDRGGPVRALGCLVAIEFARCVFDGLGAPRRSWAPCQGKVEAAHTRARGMGGAGGDRRDLVPLCSGHHLEAGERRTSARQAFEARYDLDLEAEARRIAVDLDDRGIS